MSIQQKRSGEGGRAGHEVHLGKGLAAEIAGGLVAAAVMNPFPALWNL